VLLLVASFLAWRDVHCAAEEYRQNLSDKQKEVDNLTKPDREGQIVQAGSVEIVIHPNGHLSNYPQDPPSHPLPVALVWAKIRNYGADSIAENYQLVITLNSGKQIRGTIMKVFTEVKPTDWRQRAILNSASSLVEETVERPVARGGQEVGLLMFMLEEKDYVREEIAQKGVLYDLSFQDIAGKWYHVKTVLRGGGGTEPGYIPGAGMDARQQ
jgi:hypothetical protein